MSKAEKMVEWFEDAIVEMMESYVEDIKYEEGRLEEEMEENGCETEEEYIDFLVEVAGDPIEYYIDNFGAEAFGEAVMVALGLRRWADFRR